MIKTGLSITNEGPFYDMITLTEVLTSEFWRNSLSG